MKLILHLGNDDAIRAVKLLTGTIANAIVEAKQGEQAEVETTEVVEPLEEVQEETVVEETAETTEIEE